MTANITNKFPSLSIVLPAYNEEKVIQRTVSLISGFIPAVADKYEIVVVNDGSSDSTGKILDDMASRDPHIAVVQHSQNRGYGAALRSGFGRARSAYVFYTDSDAQFDITELSLLMPHINAFDIVTGYRKDRQDPLNRKLNASLIRIFNRIFLGLKLRDVDCAFKVYRREVLDSIVLHCNGILIDTEVFFKAKRKGFTFHEVPVTHLPRREGKQTGSRLDVLVHAVRELPKLWR